MLNLLDSAQYETSMQAASLLRCAAGCHQLLSLRRAPPVVPGNLVGHKVGFQSLRLLQLLLRCGLAIQQLRLVGGTAQEWRAVACSLQNIPQSQDAAVVTIYQKREASEKHSYLSLSSPGPCC
jgi:hypothetical protein